MQPALEHMLKKRRDRSIATILGVKEREIDPHLPERSRQMLRKVVLDQFNDFYALVMDVASSLDTGEVTLNEIYLEKIDRIHDELVERASRVERNGQPLTKEPT